MKIHSSLAIVMILVPSLALAEENKVAKDVQLFSATVAVGSSLANVELNFRAKGQAQLLRNAETLPRRVDAMFHFQGSAAEAKAAELHRLDGQFRQQMGTVVELRQRAEAIEASGALFRGDEAARAEWQRLRELSMAEAGEAGATVLRQMAAQASTHAGPAGVRPLPNAEIEKVLETAAALKKSGAEAIRVVSAPSALQEFEESLLKGKLERLEKRADALRGVAVVSMAAAALLTVYDLASDTLGFTARASDRTSKPANRETASTPVPANVQTPKSVVAGAGR